MLEFISNNLFSAGSIDFLSACMLATVIIMMAQKGFAACINLYAIQSLCLAAISLSIAIGFNEPHLITAAILTFIFKVIFIPIILMWFLKKMEIKREIRFYINTTGSLIIGIVLIGLSFYIINQVSFFQALISQKAIAISLSLIFLGIFIIISHAKALSQMIGFLIIENGLTLMINLVTFGIPFVVEIGIIFDVMIMLLVTGIFLFKMKSTFHHIDTALLKNLKE